MLRTKQARKALNKGDQRHLTECGINSLAAFKRQVAFMHNTDGPRTCRECWMVAKKLSLWDQDQAEEA